MGYCHRVIGVLCIRNKEVNMSTRRQYILGVVCLVSLFAVAGWIYFIDLQSGLAALGNRYVAPGGNCGGASPCYSTIQAAVDAAQPGDEIRVAAGMYAFQPGNEQVVRVEKNLTLRGGFTTGDWNTPDPDTNPTIVNGLSQGRVMVISGTVDVTVEGLRLIYGSSTGLGAGGGLYVEDASVTLRHTWVMTNTAPNNMSGGGIYFKDGTLIVDSSIFQANRAGSGAGLLLLSCSATIQDSQIVENVATGGTSGRGGGGVLIAGDSQVTMTGNVIRDNEASFLVSGGSIALNDFNQNYSGTKSLYLFNNLIEGGYSGTGGGMYMRYGYDTTFHDLFVTATIISNTLRDNYTYYGGAGISASAEVTITRNTFVNNHAGVEKDTGFTNYGNGGGLYVSGPATIEHNLIQDNEAKGIGGEGRGGGVFLTGNSTITFRDNQVVDNLASGVLGGQGGGIWINGTKVTAERNMIQRNTATGGNPTHGGGQGGGGVYVSSNITFTNNIVTDNSVSSYVTRGSGMTIAGAPPRLYHTTIANNTGGAGHGIYILSATNPGQPVLSNAIIAHQTIGILVDGSTPQNMATLYGILWWANGTNSSGTVFAFDEFTGDPGFVDPANNDFHISAGSAARDHGTGAGITHDYDNEPRLGVPDLGADEYWAPGTLKQIFLSLLLR
jgi:hypothetical protein